MPQGAIFQGEGGADHSPGPVETGVGGEIRGAKGYLSEPLR